MNYLVDTHILLWTLTNSEKMPKNAKILLKNEHKEHTFFFSQISLYEIAIKQKIGKMSEVPQTIGELYAQLLADGYSFLPIQNAHIEAYQRIDLQDAHRDPFDRLLLATALQESMTFMTADAKLSLYTHQVDILFCV